MTAIKQFAYNNNVIPQIKDWIYGTNWPTVYICYNDTNAYVGETLDAGVIFGKEIAFDPVKRCIIVNKNKLRDNFTKSNGD